MHPPDGPTPLPPRHGAPPPAPNPRLARWLAPPGPPASRLLVHPGSDGHAPAAVLAVPGRYSVTYLLLGPEDVVVVDCGSEEDIGRVLTGLSWLGRPLSSVRAVLPTHLHFDHILGVDRLSRRLSIPLALGRVAADHVRRGAPLRFPPRRFLLRAVPTWPMQGMPVFSRSDWGHLRYGFPWSRNRFRATRGPILADGDPLPGLPGWSVLETPGHSDDSLSLYHERAGWLVTGDTLRNFLGGEWNPLLADTDAYARTRDRLKRLPVRHVLPGHGPVFDTPEGLAAIPARPWWMP